MGQLSGTAAVAQNNFVTVNKVLDYDFVEGKRVVDLVERSAAGRSPARRFPPDRTPSAASADTSV